MTGIPILAGVVAFIFSTAPSNNYRGISVTSVMSRLYGKILTDLIEEENRDEEEQSGF